MKNIGNSVNNFYFKIRMNATAAYVTSYARTPQAVTTVTVCQATGWQIVACVKVSRNRTTDRVSVTGKCHTSVPQDYFDK